MGASLTARPPFCSRRTGVRVGGGVGGLGGESSQQAPSRRVLSLRECQGTPKRGNHVPEIENSSEKSLFAPVSSWELYSQRGGRAPMLQGWMSSPLPSGGEWGLSNIFFI